MITTRTQFHKEDENGGYEYYTSISKINNYKYINK